MKQKLDQLAENNTAIVTLIKAYAPHVKTTAFTAKGDKFRNYASAWRGKRARGIAPARRDRKTD